MRKRIVLVITILLLGGLIWYLFLKPNDYIVTFKSKAITGALNQEIKLWANSLENAEFIEQRDLSNFVHQIEFNDSIHRYEWDIDPINDSMSKVKVSIKDLNNSFLNRIKIPFYNSDFEKRTKKTLMDCMMTVKEHTERFKVTVIGPSTIEPRFYAYVPLKSTQKDKALKMMENYSFLNTILVKNGLKLDGQPFIEIIDWTIEKDSISYNFCYPIVQSDTLPAIKGLEFKKLDERKALKAIYNGNYITSDRAWYHLLEYADKNHIPVKKQPLEIFYSNPNMGGNELDWKAEIFMPLQ